MNQKNDENGYFPLIDFHDEIVNFFFRAFYMPKNHKSSICDVITRVYDNFTNFFQCLDSCLEVSIKIFDRFQSNIWTRKYGSIVKLGA